PGRAGQPIVYSVIGDVVEMVPTPSTAFQIKMTYYARPSQLVNQQMGATGSARGLITAINTTARTLTMALLPANQITTNTLASGELIDIVHPDGWHELSMINVTQ